MKNIDLKVFNNIELVPEVWKSARSQKGAGIDADWYVFNPTLARVGDTYVMTYRVVDEVLKTRRIASCKLTIDLLIVSGSVTPLSDLIEFTDEEELSERSLTWHADPRYFRLGKDLYVFWNDGSLKPANHQFLLQIGPDGLTPVGKARLVRKEPYESRIEKNWQFFDAQGSTYAIYENRPLHLLSVEMAGNGVINCSDVVKTDWNTGYEEKFGHIRGGAQPVLNNGGFLTLAHSSHKNSHGKLVYHPCFYRFEPTFPFRVTHRPKGPFVIPIHGHEKHRLPPLNKQTATVVYPCGLVVEDEKAVISFGINDESCAVGVFQMADILNSMEAIEDSDALKKSSEQSGEAIKISDGRQNDSRIPLFWWNAHGKRYDPQAGGRFFATGNVGDIASKLFVEMLSNVECRPPRKNERKLLAIGSVLQNAADGDVVWGAGIKGSAEGFKNTVRELSVHAVRGPLTVDFLRRQGIDLSSLKELFDPGCLIPYLYAGELNNAVPRKRSICIIPHYKDDLILRQQHPSLANEFLSVDAMPLDFVKNLIGAETVVSSSLHGIIFAEALGIPALWLAPVNGEDELKYYDYYYGTGRYNVKRFTSIESALRAEPMDLPKFRFADYLKTFPHEKIYELCGTLPGNAVKINPDIKFKILTNSISPEQNNTVGSINGVAFERPPSFHLTEAITFFRSKNYEKGFTALISACVGAREGNDVSLQALVNRTAEIYLGCNDFLTLSIGACAEIKRKDIFRSLVVDIVSKNSIDEISSQFIDFIFEGDKSKDRIIFWKAIQALCLRKLGKYDEETSLLKAAHQANPLEFWSTIQQVYRFTIDLPSISRMVTGVKSTPLEFDEVCEPLQVYCYPSFNRTNAYQSLLYKDFEDAGNSIRYCTKISELESLKTESGKKQILHLHWVSAFFRDIDKSNFQNRIVHVLNLLERIKNNGFLLAWTIHNVVSHESVDLEREEHFNRKLYALCDWVFVHHPMAMLCIPWLPDTKKIYLIEHGSYGGADFSDRKIARYKLGLNFDGPLLSSIGNFRDYKELDKCLPIIIDVLRSYPEARFLVAGQILSPALRNSLEKVNKGQLLLIDRILSPEELNLYMDATDFGFLSYRDILTSGSLVHWLSRGIPVIAPRKGTIPAYVSDGWNGFLYDSYKSLPELIHHCFSIEPAHKNNICSNSLATGKTMRWKFI